MRCISIPLPLASYDEDIRRMLEQLSALRKSNHNLRARLEARDVEAATAGQHFSQGSNFLMQFSEFGFVTLD